MTTPKKTASFWEWKYAALEKEFREEGTIRELPQNIEQVHKNIDNLELKFAPATDSDIAPIHQILLSLLRKLAVEKAYVDANEAKSIATPTTDNDNEKANEAKSSATPTTDNDNEKANEAKSSATPTTVTDSSKLDALIKRVEQGQMVTPQDYSEITDSTLKYNLQIIINEAQQEYDAYCKGLRTSAIGILTAYKGYLTKEAPASEQVRRLYRRTFTDSVYNGIHEGQKNLVALIDQLALLDSSSKLIPELLTSLTENSTADSKPQPFDYQQQFAFMQRVYDVFENFQNNYQLQRKIEKEQYFDQFAAYYFTDCDISNKNWLDIQFSQLMKDKDDDEDNNVEITDPPKGFNGKIGKLKYDLLQYRQKIKDEDEAFEKQIKRFKKAIHHVAQEWGLPSQIIKNRQEKPAADPTKQSELDQKQLQGDVYRPRYTVARENDLETWKTLISKDQQDDRRTKITNDKIGGHGAFWSGLGEGCVAGVGATGVILLSPAFMVLIPVILCGWFINRILFKDDSTDCLNAFFRKTKIGDEYHRLLFVTKNKEGDYEPISFKKKCLIIGLGLGSIFTGVVYAALNLVDCLVAFNSLFGVAALATVTSIAPPLGILIGLSAIFFKVIADIIKNDRHKDVYRYFKQNFYDLPWSEMSKTEKLSHGVACALKLTAVLLATAVTIFVTLASFGVLYGCTVKAVQNVFSKKPSETFAFVASVVNAVIGAPLQIKSLFNVLDKIFTKLFSPNKFFSPTPQETEITQFNPLQKEAATVKKLNYAASFVAVAGNTTGQALLAQSGQTQFPHTTEYNVTVALTAGAFSAGPNMSAAISSIEDRQVEPLPSTSAVSEQKGTPTAAKLSSSRETVTPVRLALSRFCFLKADDLAGSVVRPRPAALAGNTITTSSTSVLAENTTTLSPSSQEARMIA